jgi:hypothetical protein
MVLDTECCLLCRQRENRRWIYMYTRDDNTGELLPNCYHFQGMGIQGIVVNMDRWETVLPAPGLLYPLCAISRHICTPRRQVRELLDKVTTTRRRTMLSHCLGINRHHLFIRPRCLRYPMNSGVRLYLMLFHSKAISLWSKPHRNASFRSFQESFPDSATGTSIPRSWLYGSAVP